MTRVNPLCRVNNLIQQQESANVFRVQIDNHDYGEVESLQVAMDFCLFRLGVAKRLGYYVTATVKIVEDCGSGWKVVETAWSCTTDDVSNFFGE